MRGAALARAAERYIGTKFQLHGRDPLTGFDCLGLVATALADIGRSVVLPPRYTLRNSGPAPFPQLPSQAGLVEVDCSPAPGDVLLLEAGPAQLHLALVATESGVVHAHAGLRRVVLTPFPLAWPLLRHWRLSDR